METVGFIHEVLRGFLKCLGLEGGGVKAVHGSGEVVNNLSPPSLPPLDLVASTTEEPQIAAEDTSTTDPLVDVLSSPIDSSTMKTREIDNNLGGGSNFTLLTIDEIINTSSGTTAEAHYVELQDNGQPNISLLTTSLISSGGGGKTH